MATPVVNVEMLPSFRDIKGRFTIADKQLLSDRRAMSRKQGRRFVDLAKDEAPENTGQFKSKIHYRTYARAAAGDMRGSLGFNVYAPEPLATFIQEGTKRHRIYAKRAKALRFYSPKLGMWIMVPKKPSYSDTHVRGDTLWSAKGYVDHPGTKKNPFMGRAFRRWLPGARRDLARIGGRYSRTIAGRTKVLRA